MIRFASGGTLALTNLPDGHLASVFWRAPPGGEVRLDSAGTGSWHLSENGRYYCVMVGWKILTQSRPTSFCRSVVQADDGGFILRSDNGCPDWRLLPAK
ncbi:hypothetical protein [Cupriavidus pinatubonensis]|uniref:Uncharacterized protein n=1 Tax=Cupriavidus pinatubonensis TaxID=248026 RepID=A0ABN7Z6X2_9BURK|nr:hypothetical protein [Cupriavidus pinatubonensis]CAG9180983.1 hypothetical protein LMG23994_04542 [Cupriavidus pinatubonensis]